MLNLTARRAFAVAGAVLALSVSAQPDYAGSESIFAPIPWASHDEVRLASGAPGSAYWQQHADYVIDVTLDEEAKSLSGKMHCTYTNNSKDPLRYIWLNLEQNAFKPDSIGTRSMMPNVWWRVPPDFEGGFDLGRAEVNGHEVEVLVYDAVGKINLPEPLGPGESLDLSMAFSMVIPPRGRLGMYEGEDGTVFELAHWFPNVAVYDDVHGWNILPHQGDGEFYTNFGDYDVSITVPADHLVAGAGELQNAEEVLTAQEFDLLERAHHSTETISIRSVDEIAEDRAEGTKTWKFHASNVRTFAFATSRAFAWDAAIAGEDRPVLCQAFYPREAMPLWSDEAVQFARHTINFYSEWIHEYPWSTATNVNGVVGGMEYPTIVFCSEQRNRRGLFGVTDHEFGHEWFPMMVNTNERRNAWMDEGFNTFINHYSGEAFFGAGKSTRHGGVESIARQMAADPRPQPIMTFPDRMRNNSLGFLAYGKPGYGMQLLRDYILGPERFDAAFREYVRRWAFKSPTPEDFFRTMEDAAGYDLAWFWRGWFYESAVLDQAIENVHPEPRRGVVSVVVGNRERLVMPLVMAVQYDDGTEERRELPVEAWARADKFPTSWDSDGRTIVRVEIDPDHVLPDIDRDNNVYENEDADDQEHGDSDSEDEDLDERDPRNVPSTSVRKKSSSN